MEGIPESLRGNLTGLISRLFFGLSKDGDELVTLMLPLTTAPSELLPTVSLRIFTPYATTEALPVYDAFVAGHSSDTEQSLKDAYAKYGPCVFNAPCSSGLSLFQRAVLQNQKEMTSTIMALAKAHKFELAVEWEQSKQSKNLLQSVLETHSTNEIRQAMKIVSSGLLPFCSAAAAMKGTFIHMSQQYRSLLEHALSNNLLMTEAIPLRVHEDFLSRAAGKARSAYVDTCETYLDWVNCDADSLEQQWRIRNVEDVEKMERSGNRSMEWVFLRFICIEDAAKIGMNGIIRPLLLQNVPERFYRFDAVKWVILYKWCTIWRARFVKNAVIYASFLLVFTIYAANVAASTALEDAPIWRQILVTGLLCLTTLFGFQMLLEEINQISTLLEDGRKYFKSAMWGFRYFLASKWNWVDLFSCLILLILIPLFHVLALSGSGFDGWLSACVAIEAVIAYAKVWYFAQPFRSTGALVLLISNIVKDCFIFLFLAFIVLIGFGLALHVLFRQVGTDGIDGQIVHDAFGTFERSLETTFYALLGTVDPEVYRLAGHLSWLTTLTNGVYMMVETVVLLNLLIAIMGDTFDRVKSTEETHLLMGRAAFIDACEAALSDAEKAELEKQLGRYVCVVRAQDTAAYDAAHPWMGRLDAIQRSARQDIRQSEAHLRSHIEAQERRVCDGFGRIEARLDEIQRRLEAAMSQNEDP